MTTISEAIAALRAKREANSTLREKLRVENVQLSSQILELERALAPPKRERPKAIANANDPVTTVLKAEPAVVGLKGQKV